MGGLTSIVVPCHDNLLFTALCLESIALHTPEPHEVVIVDNGCTDATSQWCADHGAHVVRSPVNLGFAGGVNLGLAEARGDVVVLLNNDTLVTPGWLRGLLGALAREPRVGIAGPRSNWVSDDQIIPSPLYTEAPSEALTRFGAERAEVHAGQGVEARRLSGLCMAISRPVLERVGGFDTRFVVGNLEDDDYSLRTRLAGFRLWIADDSYIHHFGHKTFALVDEDYDTLMYDNTVRYVMKWDLPTDADPRGLLPSRGFDPHRDHVPIDSRMASSRR